MLPTSSEGLAAFDQLLLDACALLRPPEKLTLAEWSDKYAVLSAEGSSQPGKWTTSTAEYQREPMEALSDPRIATVVLPWASQVGKTQIGLNWVGCIAEHDPGPILFIEPTEDLAKVIVKDRIKPMFRDTPVLRPLLHAGSDLFHMGFPGGQLSMGWANSPSQLASRPIRFLITDEEGRYDANKEGDPVDQARKRMATFSNRKHLRVSSPALRRTCRITKAYEHSDRRVYLVPCPHCGVFQWLQFKNLMGAGDAVFYRCEANACVIEETDKGGMIRAGRWHAENPGGGDGKTAGFQLSALYSTIGYTWAEIMADFRKCEGIPDKLQVFTNTVLAEPWDEQAEGADLNEVQRHAEDYAAQAPAWVVLVTCGADVQKDRIEATKWGFGLNEQSGVIEHRIFHGDTSDARAGAWLLLDEWRRETVEHESGIQLPVACTFVDSGDGNRTEAVYAFTKPREAQGVRACKGSSLSGAPLVGEARRVGRIKALLCIVGTSTAKDTIYARLRIADRTRPGYVHFPRHIESGCGPEYFKHLTAEELVTTRTRGGEVSKWINVGKRNEALDCAVYARAAMVFTRASVPQLARAMAAKIERLRLAGQLQPPQPPAPPEHAAPSSAASLPSPSAASSPASPSPAKARLLSKTVRSSRKVVRRPGFGWIHR